MSPIAVAVLAGLLVLAVAIVRADRRRSRARARVLSAFGFAPPAPVEPGAARALLALFRAGPHARAGEGLTLARAQRCGLAAGDLYAFDVVAPRRRRGSRVATGAVGMIRPGLGLPRFEVLGYPASGGAAGGLMVRMIASGLGHGTAVPVDDPELARRLTVLAPPEADPAAVQRFLAPALREALLRAGFVLLTAGGDAFALQPQPFVSGRAVEESALLRGLLDDTLALGDAFAAAASVSATPAPA